MIEEPSTDKVSSVPVPVTVVAGFLGAGKTTLINHVLNGNHGRRIAVVVNDFGSINIDSELITDLGQGMVSLANGCICCVIRSDLVSAVLKLAADEDRPEHIIVESSGVANPASVEISLMLPQIWNTAQYAGTVSVVDADQVLSLTDEQAALAEQQVRGGDLIVLNKVDLVSEARVAEVRALLEGIKPGVQIIEATHCDLPVELLLGGRSIDRHSSVPHTTEGRHEHDQMFESWSYQSGRPLQLGLFQELLKHFPREILRAKGFVFTADAPHKRYLLQLVGRRATIAVNGAWDGLPPETRLVFVAKSNTVNFEAVEQALNGCIPV